METHWRLGAVSLAGHGGCCLEMHWCLGAVSLAGQGRHCLETHGRLGSVSLAGQGGHCLETHWHLGAYLWQGRGDAVWKCTGLAWVLTWAGCPAIQATIQKGNRLMWEDPRASSLQEPC